MKKILSLLLLVIFGIGFAQKVKKEEKVKDQFESRQPQDMSAPPPPMVAFPAQYPKGNKAFLNDISKKFRSICSSNT